MSSVLEALAPVLLLALLIVAVAVPVACTSIALTFVLTVPCFRSKRGVREFGRLHLITFLCEEKRHWDSPTCRRISNLQQK